MSKIQKQDYEEVLKRNPNDIKSMIALGQKLLQQQKRNQALYWFDAAISLDPNMVDSLCGKGDALQLFDKHQKAIQWYDRALNIAPNHVPSLVGKAKALYQLELDFNKLAKPKVLNKQITESSLYERGMYQESLFSILQIRQKNQKWNSVSKKKKIKTKKNQKFVLKKKRKLL
ncbi:unnamed protein product [Paramecium sonneborni]|uniref:Tetratricopeptide repeat protein n=1 Tax=Paramecium sonneborni TaxID=65129 RepID=A0A8S1N6S0_9CILI|nr:unnamed protein product [Paramecium sonneborni]